MLICIEENFAAVFFNARRPTQQLFYDVCLTDFQAHGQSFFEIMGFTAYLPSAP